MPDQTTVSMQAEFRSDGIRATTIKPSQLACARITVLRASGPRMGVPFIDDYIKAADTVCRSCRPFQR